MRFQNQAVCKRCNKGMEAVATIAPMSGGPGLVAFMCQKCGAAQSILIHPTNPAPEVNRGEATEH